MTRPPYDIDVLHATYMKGDGKYIVFISAGTWLDDFEDAHELALKGNELAIEFMHEYKQALILKRLMEGT